MIIITTFVLFSLFEQLLYSCYRGRHHYLCIVFFVRSKSGDIHLILIVFVLLFLLEQKG